MKLIQVKPPHVAGILIAVSVGLHFLVPKPSRGGLSCLTCSAVAFLLGFGVMIWAWWLFRRAGTPIRPTAQAVSLVTSGPFRLSRNPMYLGIVVMLLGIALFVGSWPMLIPPLGFFVLMSLVFIPFEEQRLRQVFGEAYDSYARRVRRWI
jgi:protein-S-isoprenylcysteine O-methyltransferase Ste14